eukprot:5513413-Pleurochrysis_carterae.AAC.2
MATTEDADVLGQCGRRKGCEQSACGEDEVVDPRLRPGEVVGRVEIGGNCMVVELGEVVGACDERPEGHRRHAGNTQRGSKGVVIGG